MLYDYNYYIISYYVMLYCIILCSIMLYSIYYIILYYILYLDISSRVSYSISSIAFAFISTMYYSYSISICSHIYICCRYYILCLDARRRSRVLSRSWRNISSVLPAWCEVMAKASRGGFRSSFSPCFHWISMVFRPILSYFQGFSWL